MTSRLLPPNTTSQERAAENATARLADVPTPLRELWNPDTCPEELLPWLAWALGIDNWKTYWPVSVKRELVRKAIGIKRSYGTAKSVRDTASAFGSAVALRENWQKTPPGAAHGFDISINVNEAPQSGVTAEFIQDIYDEIGRAKPARSYFSVTAGVSASAAVAMAACGRPLLYQRIKVGE